MTSQNNWWDEIKIELQYNQDIAFSNDFKLYNSGRIEMLEKCRQQHEKEMQELTEFINKESNNLSNIDWRMLEYKMVKLDDVLRIIDEKINYFNNFPNEMDKWFLENLLGLKEKLKALSKNQSQINKNALTYRKDKVSYKEPNLSDKQGSTLEDEETQNSIGNPVLCKNCGKVYGKHFIDDGSDCWCYNPNNMWGQNTEFEPKEVKA